MSEVRTIARHAGTILAGQLATIAYGVTDTVVAGRYAQSSLAALSVGSALYMSVYVALMGVIQSLLPVWAELHGAGRPQALGHALRQSVYAWLALVAIGLLVLLNPAPLLEAARVPASLRPEVVAYLKVLAGALPLALAFRLYSTLNQSLGMPQLVTWLQLGSLGLKIPLSIVFTFGLSSSWTGLGPLGAPGCAWATLVVQAIMVLLALWMLRHRTTYRDYALWQWPGRPDATTLRTYARLGIPSGLTILVEVTSFTLMALFVARLGTTAAAGHQIAANLAAVLYMMPLAIGLASSARVSYWLGSGHAVQARKAVRIGFMMVAASAAVLAIGLGLVRTPLARLYSSDPDVVAQAVVLLGWVAVYHLFDGLQALGVFMLRCWRVTVMPFVVYAVLLWGLGLAGGYMLAYRGIGPWPASMHPSAFWMAGAAALAMAACSFWAIMWRILRREMPL